MTLIKTAGSEAANTYADADDVAAFVPSTPYVASWEAVEDAENLILRARFALDALAFAGVPVSQSQALPWPRFAVAHPSGGMWDTTLVPVPIKNAQAWIAAYLSSIPATDADPFGSDDTTWKISQLSIGPISLSFVKGAPSPGKVFVANVVRPYLAQYGLVGPRGAVRLTR
jgi:hypothetical protein